MPELRDSIHATGPGHFGVAERGIIALVNEDRLRRILTRMLDENEFLSPYGIRSLSRYHAEHPYVFSVDGQEYRVDYLPAESDTGMFGGNSNWRGPIWMPVNALIIRALLHYYSYYGDNFKIECPTGSGNLMNLFEVAREIANRLTRIFLRDEIGPAPGVRRQPRSSRHDPHWRDHLLFYEYFHGDNGAGIGASHQTGWTGVIANLIEIFGKLDAETFLQGGRGAAFRRRKAGTPEKAVRRCLPAPRYPSLYPDQYPCLASAAVPRGRQADHPGRHRRRDDRRLRRTGLRLDLAVERVADRRRRPGRLARQPANGAPSSKPFCPT